MSAKNAIRRGEANMSPVVDLGGSFYIAKNDTLDPNSQTRENPDKSWQIPLFKSNQMKWADL